MKTSWRTPMVMAILVVVAGATVIALLNREPAAVAVETVTSGVVRDVIEEEGKTRLRHRYLITMPVTGFIQRIDFEPGDTIEQGGIVAQMVREDLETRLEEAEARVERLKASIRENQDSALEETTRSQADQFVTSIDQVVQAARERARAGKARLEYAEANFRRIRSIYERSAGSVDDLNQAQLQFAEAEANHRQDELVVRALEAMAIAADLIPLTIDQYLDRKQLGTEVLQQQLREALAQQDQARLDLERAEVVSPVDGVVLDRIVEARRYLHAGEPLLEIGSLADLEVEAELLTADAFRIRPGSTVEVLVEGSDTTPFPAIVRRVHPDAFTKLSSLGVEQQRVVVRIDFDREAIGSLSYLDMLGSGYRVTVRIEAGREDDVLNVPRAALRRSDNSGWTVRIVSEDRVATVPIQLGLLGEDRAEVLKGLEAGDLVILDPDAAPADGGRVQPL